MSSEKKQRDDTENSRKNEDKDREAPKIDPGAIEKVLPGDEQSSALKKAARVPEPPKDEKEKK